MSMTAGIVIVLILAARLLLKRAPKVFSYALWAVVLFRLVCPVSFSSQFSLIGLIHTPSSTVIDGAYSSIAYIPADIVHTEFPQVDLPVPDLSEAINESLPQGGEQLAADPLEFPMAAATMLWLFGIGGMMIYSAVSLLRLQRKLIGAVRLRDNIYLADHIVTPFVIGILRPKIYLPSTLGEEEQSYVILHEQTHIRRLDHIVKMLAFLALAVHWFNPLVWVAFVFAVKDMEMSCDERVLKLVGRDIRGEYSASLLSLAAGRRLINGSPLAFGEGNIKGRIKNIMNFKKPAAWVIVISILLVAALSIAFAANGAVNASDPDGYKSLFKERFAEARKVGLHYTATKCRGRDAIPEFSAGGTEYYMCEHYKSKAGLRAASEAIFTENFIQDFYSRLDSEAFVERDGRLYIAPRYLYDASVWQAEDKITFNGQTTDTFLWDTLTVKKAEDTKISYTLDWYHTYPGPPITSSFTLVKGEDGIWRFDECFGEAYNDLVAYVDDTLSETEARGLQSRIEQIPDVEYVEFVTREEALKRFMDKYEDKSIFEGIDAGVFRNRYNVRIRDISLIERTMKDISRIGGIVGVSAASYKTPHDITQPNTNEEMLQAVPSAEAPSAEGFERILYEIAGSVAYRAENGEDYLEVTYADPSNPRVLQIVVIAGINKHPQGFTDTLTLEPDYIRHVDASDAEYITNGYRMSNRGIDRAVLTVIYEDGSSLKYENLYADWLKVRNYGKSSAEEMNAAGYGSFK
ncbi:MAG: hypothetical protein GX936_09315 [Clostridiales bacterium]|nr:hypothetical protein [Clostridiales bacterium]